MKEAINKNKLSFVTKGLVAAIVVIALLALVTGVASANDYYVATTGSDTTGDGGSDNPWQTIQYAVYNASVSAGDEIVVYAGTYTESIVVNKSVTLRACNTTYDVTVNSTAATQDAITVSADHVNISWLKVQNATAIGNAGINITTVGYANISNVWATSNYYGIWLFSSSNNTLINNTATGNIYGILLNASSNNTLTDNNASYNKRIGIHIETGSINNTIAGGTVRNNTYNPSDDKEAGITILASSNNNTIAGVSIFNNSQNGIYLEANFTKITSNNLWNNTWNGIYLKSSSGNSLTGNTASGNAYGIWLKSSSNNNLTGNTADNNTEGILLYSSSNNNFTDNNASYNQRAGIYIQTSSIKNTITGGTVHNNSYNPSDGKEAGITILASSDNNTITGVSIFNNSQNGIYLEANFTNISSNTIQNNTWNGINLTSSDNNTLTNNTANNNTIGIALYDLSSNNTLTNNTADNNINTGIYLESSSNNSIYNNYFNNTNNTGFNGATNNTWNTTQTPGVNIAGGPYLGGNFWAYPNGTGFSQTCIDADFDGICDSSYSFGSGNVDYLPLSTKRRHIVNKTAPACTVGHSYHTTIQAAIDNASAGDGIIICAGTYTESIIVNKAVTLTAFNKSSYDVTVQAAASQHAITVSADHVNISWLKVQNALDAPYLVGIKVSGVGYANLSYNWVTSSKTMWTNYGISLFSSNNNTLIGNTVDNKSDGIRLKSASNYNNLTGNTANNNGNGIYLESASYNNLTNNTAENNGHGIWLLSSSNKNNLTGNTAENNLYGIYLWNSGSNTLTGNTANSNSIYGIRLYDANSNTIYNNYFNNTNHVYFYRSVTNTWNTTQQAGTNIVGGPNLGGNFWAKPSGTGHSQTCTDSDRDGICDTNYSLASGNVDYLPLAIWSASPPPNITSWSNSKTNNNATSLTISTSESVYFNATANQTITNWHWYKDGIYQNWNYDNITLNWSTPGSKTVAVRATNANGTTKEVKWTISVQAPEETPVTRRGGGRRVPPINVPVDPATGAVTSNTTLTVDGATLRIPEGTIIKDAEGNPLSTSIIMLY
ncbi:MAG: right-handed parallel beta-helix repeat-containing protein, partial [Desulfobacterales bacterium]|nr:right-handed parallel beta-helix repeat-containing protein [Desulfobacterales bacterium]